MSVTVVVAPLAIVASTQVTFVVKTEQDWAPVDDRKAIPVPRTAVKTTLLAGFGPLLVTSPVKVSGLPAAIGSGLSVIETDRSAVDELAGTSPLVRPLGKASVGMLAVIAFVDVSISRTAAPPEAPTYARLPLIISIGPGWPANAIDPTTVFVAVLMREIEAPLFETYTCVPSVVTPMPV